MGSTMTQTLNVPAARLFGREIAEARRLGYRVQLKVTGTAAVVRLVPKTQRAKRHAAITAPDGVNDPQLECVVVIPAPQHRVDAVHQALTTALEHARQAGA
jgi:cell division protein FtsI/penicillin-binding protein 2